MDIKREVSDIVTIPDRCKGCNHLEGLGDLYDLSSEGYQGILDAGLNGDIARQFVESLMRRTGLTREDAEQVARDNSDELRRVTLEFADGIDEDRERSIELMKEILAGCSDGLLKMRATRNGKQVIVSLCMSDAIQEIRQIRGDIELVREERNY